MSTGWRKNMSLQNLAKILDGNDSLEKNEDGFWQKKNVFDGKKNLTHIEWRIWYPPPHSLSAPDPFLCQSSDIFEDKSLLRILLCFFNSLKLLFIKVSPLFYQLTLFYDKKEIQQPFINISHSPMQRGGWGSWRAFYKQTLSRKRFFFDAFLLLFCITSEQSVCMSVSMWVFVCVGVSVCVLCVVCVCKRESVWEEERDRRTGKKRHFVDYWISLLFILVAFRRSDFWILNRQSSGSF